MRKAETNLKIEKLCQLFGIPASSYYYTPVESIEKDNTINIMRTIHQENFQCYGKRRMSIALQSKGINIGVFKVASLM